MSIAVTGSEGWVRWRDRSVWWARRKPEESRQTEVCGRDGKEGRHPPFDLYCSGDQEHFLVFSGSRVAHHIVLNGYRVALGVLVLVSANSKTAWPIYAAGWLVGLALLWLPLRAFRVSRVVALGVWTTAISLAAADFENALSAESMRVLATTAAIGAILGGTATVWMHPFEVGKEHGETGLLAVRSIATGVVFGAAVALLVILDSTPLAGHLVHASTPARHAGLVVGLATLTGAAAVAATSGFLWGVRITDRLVVPLFVHDPSLPNLNVPRPPDVRRPVFQGRDIAARFAYATNVFAVTVAQRVTDALNALLDVLARGILVLKEAFQTSANLVHRVLVLTARALRAALVATGRVIYDAIIGVILPLRRYHRSTIATAAVLGVAAGLTVYSGHRFGLYLFSGGLSNAAIALAIAPVVPAVLALAWWTTTGWPWGEIRSAAGRMLALAGPTAYVLVLALAWADGILGWAGVGPIRPGWLTGLGTTMLAFVYVAGQRPGWFGLRQRRGSLQ